MMSEKPRTSRVLRADEADALLVSKAGEVLRDVAAILEGEVVDRRPADTFGEGGEEPAEKAKGEGCDAEGSRGEER